MAQLRRLFAHNAWNDARTLEALTRSAPAPADALRECAHVIAAESIWHGRITGAPVGHAVFPEWSLEETRAEAARVHAGWDALLDACDGARLDGPIRYVTTTGQPFTTALGDILLHVALHGQYHRGKINLLLRQAGHEPPFTDYIFWVRERPVDRGSTSG